MNDESMPYDEFDLDDILNYAKRLEGMRFHDILTEAIPETKDLSEEKERYDNKRHKGGLGELVETYYFKYAPNNRVGPDFKEVGLELKVTPYSIKKNGELRAGERLVIGMIPNNKPIDKDFYTSDLFNKMVSMLLVYYERIDTISRTENSISYVIYYDLLSNELASDLKIIIEDYKKIVSLIKAGKAHELSEGMTRYLGAATKGATAKKSYQPQFYGDIPAKRRAFSLKQSYMSAFLNRVVSGRTQDSILSGDENQSFENVLKQRLSPFIGKTQDELGSHFGIGNKAKNRNSMVVLRMLGVKTDNADEFEKSDIKIKTFRVNKDFMPKEHISFPAISFSEFDKGKVYEESNIYNTLSERSFFIVLFRENDLGQYELFDSFLWHMPVLDVESVAKYEWELYRDKVQSGVNFTLKRGNNESIRVENDLPKASSTQILHMRPHASKAAYDLPDLGYKVGTQKDMDVLPNGDKMTKQCFWINKSYMKQQIIENR